MRAKEIRDMLIQNGLGDHAKLLIGHLLTENGALAEDRHGDWVFNSNGSRIYACSIGIIQWNTCYHSGMNVERFLSVNPEWGEWRYQVQHWINEMKWRKDAKGSIEEAIASWNPGARPYYLRKVQCNAGVKEYPGGNCKFNWAGELLE